MRWLMLGVMFASLMGCASSPAQQEAAREAWKAHDLERARGCGGRAIDGVCLHGGGP
jgi:hypothetical protein